MQGPPDLGCLEEAHVKTVASRGSCLGVRGQWPGRMGRGQPGWPAMNVSGRLSLVVSWLQQYSFPVATVAKYHNLSINSFNQIYSLTMLEIRSPKTEALAGSCSFQERIHLLAFSEF